MEEIFSFISSVFGWKNEKVEKQKTYFFDWEEKWEDRNWSWYKFIVISLLNKTKDNTFFY